MYRPERRALVSGIALLLTAGIGAAASPRRRLAVELGPLDLERNIPRRMADWTVDQSMVPVLPSADVQERLDQIYNQVFSRTYVDDSGKRIMFLIAYGADQADRMTLAHLPESCYSSQGFEVLPTAPAHVDVASRSLGIVRLRTRKSSRVEPVTYWTTVGEHAFNDEVGRRLARARYALRGIIPDGMLVRVSSIDTDEPTAFRRQAQFVADLYTALPPTLRGRLFGQDS